MQLSVNLFHESANSIYNKAKHSNVEKWVNNILIESAVNLSPRGVTKVKWYGFDIILIFWNFIFTMIYTMIYT